MTVGDYTLRYDDKHHVLLIAFGKQLTNDIFMAGYDAVRRFAASRGPCSMIADFSAVENFDLSNEFLRRLGGMSGAVPAEMKRIAVAPQPVIYGAARAVQARRTESRGDLTVLRTLDEANTIFGARASDFVAVDLT